MNFLIGKTITGVKNIGHLDLYEDGEYVMEVYKIDCSGEVFYISASAGDLSGAYTQIYQLDSTQIKNII